MLLAILAAAAICAGIVGAYIGEIIWTIALVLAVLAVGGTVLLVHLLRRDRLMVTGAEGVRELPVVYRGQPVTAPARLAIAARPVTVAAAVLESRDEIRR